MNSFVLGGFPRSSRARKALRALEEGSAHPSDVERIALEENIALAWLQVGAGLSMVSDPVIEWHDMFRPFVEAWRGCFAGGLLRFFDNNFFYRVPIFVEMPSPAKLVLKPRVLALLERLPKWVKLKVVVPGPVTFAKMSRAPPGASFEEFAEALAKLLSEEVKAATEAGAKAVEVDEPWLVDVDASVDDASLAVELFNKYFAKLGIETVLATYFAPPSPEVWRALCEAKASYLAIDVADSPKRAVEALRKALPEGLALGIVQARDLVDPPLERLAEVLDLAKDCKRLAVTTSSWLDLLPFDSAIDKVRKLASIARELSR